MPTPHSLAGTRVSGPRRLICTTCCTRLGHTRVAAGSRLQATVSGLYQTEASPPAGHGLCIRTWLCPYSTCTSSPCIRTVCSLCSWSQTAGRALSAWPCCCTQCVYDTSVRSTACTEARPTLCGPAQHMSLGHMPAVCPCGSCLRVTQAWLGVAYPGPLCVRCTHTHASSPPAAPCLVPGHRGPRSRCCQATAPAAFGLRAASLVSACLSVRWLLGRDYPLHTLVQYSCKARTEQARCPRLLQYLQCACPSCKDDYHEGASVARCFPRGSAPSSQRVC